MISSSVVPPPPHPRKLQLESRRRDGAKCERQQNGEGRFQVEMTNPTRFFWGGKGVVKVWSLEYTDIKYLFLLALLGRMVLL